MRYIPFLLLFAIILAACGSTDAMDDTPLVIEDVIEGTGTEARSGMRVTVHYVGTLDDGTVFDSSRRSDQPFSFTLGSRQVIAGWDQGVEGMKVGGVRRLVVPPSLGYGSAPRAGIPANSTLYFEIELLAAQTAGTIL
jgi:FKBP-type peptidyl-prolyl cis-trans isomerase